MCILGMVALLLFAVMAAPAAQADAKSVIFLGGAYDSPDKGFIGSVGGGTQVTGGLWTLGHGKFGDNAALEWEAAYFVPLYDGLTAGLIAGPGADWVQEDVGITPVSYLTGAAGGLLGYHGEKIGIYAGGKYKFTYKDNTAYPIGWRVGLWLAYNP
jgi:hypothetical protein